MSQCEELSGPHTLPLYAHTHIFNPPKTTPKPQQHQQKFSVEKKPKTWLIQYGWIMIMNIFFRQLFAIFFIVFFSNFIEFGLACVALLYAGIAALLCHFKPYQENR